MKVLHIYDVAGVGVELSKWLKINGVNSFVILRENAINSHLSDQIVRKGTKRFLITAMIKSLRYKIIHVHSLYYLVPFLRLMNKKVVLHYHGSDIRERWNGKKKRFHRFANQIIVSTPDLLTDAPSDTIYLPNSVRIDTERKIYRPKTALFVITREHDLSLSLAEEQADLMGLNLEIFDRTKGLIDQDDFFGYLASFEYLFDIKQSHGKIIPAFSLTGLEALALGLKVYHNGVLHDTFPENHKTEHVLEQLISIYEAL